MTVQHEMRWLDAVKKSWLPLIDVNEPKPPRVEIRSLCWVHFNRHQDSAPASAPNGRLHARGLAILCYFLTRNVEFTTDSFIADTVLDALHCHDLGAPDKQRYGHSDQA